jgi:hypothetical protein
MLLQDSTPRIVKFGEYPGGACGGTHVVDISIINSLKVIIIFGFPGGLPKFSTESTTSYRNWGAGGSILAFVNPNDDILCR